MRPILATMAAFAALACLADPLPALVQQELPAAPVPRTLGVFRPEIGLLAGHLESRMAPLPIFETGEPTGKWAPSGSRDEFWNRGRLGPKGTSQITAFELIWVSRALESEGPMVVRFHEQNADGTLGPLAREVSLAELPRGGPEGEARAWKVLVDLSGGQEFLLKNPSGFFYWSLACPESETGPYLAFPGPGTGALQPEGMSLVLHGSPPGVTAFHPRNPGPGDSLVLIASTPDPEGWVHWELPGTPEGGPHYLLLASARLENPHGQGTLLVDEAALLDSPIPMEEGRLCLRIPDNGSSEVFAQAVDGLGRAWSNGIRLRW